MSDQDAKRRSSPGGPRASSASARAPRPPLLEDADLELTSPVLSMPALFDPDEAAELIERTQVAPAPEPPVWSADDEALDERTDVLPEALLAEMAPPDAAGPDTGDRTFILPLDRVAAGSRPAEAPLPDDLERTTVGPAPLGDEASDVEPTSQFSLAPDLAGPGDAPFDPWSAPPPPGPEPDLGGDETRPRHPLRAIDPEPARGGGPGASPPQRRSGARARWEPPPAPGRSDGPAAGGSAKPAGAPVPDDPDSTQSLALDSLQQRPDREPARGPLRSSRMAAHRPPNGTAPLPEVPPGATAERPGAWSREEGRREPTLVGRLAEYTVNRMRPADPAQRRNLALVVGVLGLLLAGGVLWTVLSAPGERPTREELLLLYPYGFQGAKGPRGETAPGAAAMTYTFKRNVSCTKHGEPECLLYEYSSGSFVGSMVLRKIGDDWQRISDEGLPFVPR